MKLGIVMDPIADITIKKDSSFAMLLEAQARGYDIFYMEPHDVFLDHGVCCAKTKRLEVEDNPKHWFEFSSEQTIPLADLEVLLIRNDPPFDGHYLALTHLLALAEAAGVLVVNRPASVRDYNEKLATQWFPEYSPQSMVTSDADQIKAFVTKHKKAIVKPLDAMGGSSIFVLQAGDVNVNVILETITKLGTELVMVQEYIPEISQGDKRILMIDGKPVDYALARIPGAGEFRGNLAKGARAKGQALSAHDRKICATIGPKLKEKGLMFVGLDVIGEYLTEINVTSPTCIRELDAEFGLNIAGQLFDAIEAKL